MNRIKNKKITLPIELSNIRRYDVKKTKLVKYKYIYNMKIGKNIVARNQVIHADNEKILEDLIIWNVSKAIEYWTKD